MNAPKTSTLESLRHGGKDGTPEVPLTSAPFSSPRNRIGMPGFAARNCS
jgi:hypothetical protein